MNFDDILLEILNEFLEGKKVDIEEYCKKYPEYKDDIIARLNIADFIKRNFREEDLSGKKIGEYTILQELGRGGMGVVFLGIHSGLSRLTAIKILPPTLATDKESLDNFQKEAKVIAKFNHPNIVPVYSISEEKGLYYIAMGYIAGSSLQAIIESLGKNNKPQELKALAVRAVLNDKEQDISQKSITLKRGFKFWEKSYFQFVASIGAEIADALSYAHQNGIIHGDLKPSNILLTNEAIPMVVDFGLSRDIKQLALSQTEEFTGTILYAAPEQITKNVINDKTDIWSLGVILYELLTFKNPFRENTIKKTVDKIIKSYPVPLRSYNNKIPKELEAIVFKCLEKKPENRYSSISEITKDLNNYLELKPISAKKIGFGNRVYLRIRRYPVAAIILLGLCISLALAGTYVYIAKLNNLITEADSLRPKGQLHEAQKLYERALKLSINIPLTKQIREKALLGIGDLLSGSGQPAKIMPYYEKCLQINPRNVLALHGKVVLYRNMGNREEMKKCLLGILKIAPQDWIAIDNYASLLREEGEIDLALSFLAEQCKKGVIAEKSIVNFEFGRLIEALFGKLGYDLNNFDDYYKIKKVLKLKGFDKKCIDPIIEKMLELNVYLRHKIHAMQLNEPLRKLAIEKQVIPEHVDATFVNEYKENGFRMWLASEMDYKVKIIDSIKELWGKNGVVIKKPSIFYVSLMNVVFYERLKNNLYKPKQNVDSDNLYVLSLFKYFAIMSGDYYDGRSKIESLRQILGEEGFEKFKKDNPEKYEDFLDK